MRLSSDRTDPGYEEFLIARSEGARVEVFLDGRRVEGAITADEDAGLVARYVYGERLPGCGLRVILADPNDPSVPLVETVRGRVRIVRAVHPRLSGS